MSVLKNFDMSMKTIETPPLERPFLARQDSLRPLLKAPSTRDFLLKPNSRKQVQILDPAVQQSSVRFNEMKPKFQLGEVTIRPSKHGDTYIEIPTPPSPPSPPKPPTPPEEHIQNMLDKHLTTATGQKYKGWSRLPPEKALKKKMMELAKNEKDNNRMLNWVDVRQIDNFKTPLGEASIKGLQNNERGNREWTYEDDLNNPHYYSTHYRPTGPIKVPNINAHPDDDPVMFHNPQNVNPRTMASANLRTALPQTFKAYQQRKVQEMFGAPLKRDTRDGDYEEEEELIKKTLIIYFYDLVRQQLASTNTDQRIQTDGKIVGGDESNDKNLGTTTTFKSGYALKQVQGNTQSKTDSKGMTYRPGSLKIEKPGTRSGFNFSQQSASQIIADKSGPSTKVYLTREQEILSMKTLSRGDDFTLGKTKSDAKRYEYYGSSRYVNEKENPHYLYQFIFQALANKLLSILKSLCKHHKWRNLQLAWDSYFYTNYHNIKK